MILTSILFLLFLFHLHSVSKCILLLRVVAHSDFDAEVRGENTPERKFALTGDRTHNHQVTSPSRSPLSQTKRGVYKATDLLLAR